MGRRARNAAHVDLLTAAFAALTIASFWLLPDLT
jgi:hypothetical protein